MGECETYKERREKLEKMRKIDECGMKFVHYQVDIHSSEMDGGYRGNRKNTSKTFLCNIWKTRDERPNVGGDSIRSRNDARSRKGCVDNGQKTTASNK